MEFRPVKINNSLLIEGETYPFTILGQMEFDSGESYMVMRDLLGFKMLMPAGFYKHYHFLEGQTIMCRVDKINCNGRMFLEPQNPWYTQGQVFEFEVVCSGQRLNIAGVIEYYYLINDASGKKWRVSRPPKINAGTFPEKVSCLIRRIKKGQLYLDLHGVNLNPGCLLQGRWYEFLIVDDKVNPDDGFSYFIVEDANGHRHMIRKKYYVNYRLRKGSSFTGIIDGIFGNGYLFIEPKHPNYEIGGDYIFEVNRLEEYVFSDGTRQKIIALKDSFNEDIKVIVNERAAMEWAPYKNLKCRVFKIRKSRVEVEIIAPA